MDMGDNDILESVSHTESEKYVYCVCVCVLI